VKFFDRAEIRTDEKYIIKAIIFIKTYKINSYNLELKSKQIMGDC
jgi:hypothetical protein